MSISVDPHSVCCARVSVLCLQVTRVYKPEFPLKYGCNPHQAPSGILSVLGSPLPFEVRKPRQASHPGTGQAYGASGLVKLRDRSPHYHTHHIRP